MVPGEKQEQELLPDSAVRLAAIVESSEDAILGIDLNGIIQSWNKGAENMYGFTESEVVGLHLSLIMPPDRERELPLILERVLRGETLGQFETVRVRKDGRPVSVSMTISPVRNENGAIIGFSSIGRNVTEQRISEEIIRQQAALVDQMRDAVITTDMEGYITSWNRGAMSMFQYAEEEILGKHISILYPEGEVLEHDVIEPLKAKGEHECEVLVKRKSGETFFVLVLLRLIKNSTGRAVGMIGSAVDISLRKRTEDKIRRDKEEWEQTFDAIPDIVAVIDNQFRILRANKALAIRLGVDRESLIGTQCHKTLCGMDEPLPNCPGKLAVLSGKETIEERFVERMGGHFLITCTPIKTGPEGVISFVEVCRDISEQKKLERRLQDAATTDELTMLLNRRGFLALAEHQLHQAKRESRIMALLFLDLNNMKLINDKYGHKEGDRALIDTATLLRKTFRESDILARLGGDEFAALLVNPSTREIGRAVSEHIRHNLAEHNMLQDRPYLLSLSIGIAYYDPESGRTLDTLLAEADSLMYREKERYKHDRELETEASKEGGMNRRRLYDRFAVDESWRAEIENVGIGAIKNISANGICVETQGEIRVGARYHVIVHAPERVIGHDMVGVWSQVRTGDDAGERHAASGLKIVGSDRTVQLA